MVQPKSKGAILDHMRDTSERFNRDYPIIDTRWVVEEYYTSEYMTRQYDDQWQPEHVKGRWFFDDAASAEEWMNDHDADKGAHLRVVKEYLRRFTYTKWCNA